MGRSVDQRADVYGAGVVLYMLVCGRGPWDDATSHASVFAEQIRAAPRAPSRYAAQRMPDALDAAVLLAMNIDPNERFHTARAFEAALDSIANSCGGLQAGPLDTVPVVADGNRNRLDLSTKSATFRLSDAIATQTELQSAQAGHEGRYGLGVRVLAFLISSAIAGLATWWVLGLGDPLR